MTNTRPNAPIWLKVLVFLHVVSITLWALPNPREGILQGNIQPTKVESFLLWNYDHPKQFGPMRGYLFAVGFWQYWDMFCPNPATTDLWFDAVVEYRDGTKKPFPWPRMHDLSILEKYVKERFRKFYERVNNPDYAYFWPPVGQRIAFLADDPNNPPVRVEFRRHTYPIPPPGKTDSGVYRTEEFYVYQIDQAWLRRDREAGI
jgi:hypothetical protein